jgi:hypothetical protein
VYLRKEEQDDKEKHAGYFCGATFLAAAPLNTSLMGRYGDGGGAMFRATLGYGLTENLKISISAPIVFDAEPSMPARVAAFTPMAAILRDWSPGAFTGRTPASAPDSRLPRSAAYLCRDLSTRADLNEACIAVSEAWPALSRVSPLVVITWTGVSYQRYAESGVDRRPDLLFYSAVYAYRPPSWRTDTGWDWRIFGELLPVSAPVRYSPPA